MQFVMAKERYRKKYKHNKKATVTKDRKQILHFGILILKSIEKLDAVLMLIYRYIQASWIVH